MKRATVYSVGELRLAFGENGVLTLNGEKTGHWETSGNALTLAAEDIAYTMEIYVHSCDEVIAIYQRVAAVPGVISL